MGPIKTPVPPRMDIITGFAEKLQWRKSGVAMLLKSAKRLPATPEKVADITNA